MIYFLHKRSITVRSCFPAILSLIFLIFISHLSSHGQEANQTDSIPASTDLILLSEIPDEAERNRLLLRRFNDWTASFDQSQTIGEDFINAKTEIDSAVIILLKNIELFQLSDLDKRDDEMALFQEQFEGWKNTITDLLADAEVLNTEIKAQLTRWTISLDTLSKTAPAEDILNNDDFQNTLNNVQTYIAELDAAQKTLDNNSLNLQPLLTSINLALDNLLEARSRLSEQHTLVVSKLYVPEYPPIWSKSWYNEAPKMSIPTQIIYQENRTIIQGWLRVHPSFYYFVISFLLLLLANLFYYRISKRTPEHEANAIDLVLQRPVATSILITWFFQNLIYDTPRELKRLLGMVIFIPFVMILWEMKRGQTNRLHSLLIFILFGLYYLFLPYLQSDPISLRLSLLAGGIAALLFLIFLSNDPKHTGRLHILGLFITPLIRLSIFICAVAIVANIVGSVQLCQLLLLGVIGSMLLIVIIDASVFLSLATVHFAVVEPLSTRSLIVRNYSGKILDISKRGLMIAGTILWLILVMQLFSIWGSFYKGLINVTNYRIVVGELNISLVNIFAFFLTIWISIWLSRLILFFLEEEVYARTHPARRIPSMLSLIIRYSAIVIGFLLAISAAGISLDKMAIALGALGVGIGFGLQNVVNNFISGLILSFERPISVGDSIEVGALSGVVTDIGFRASRVRTYDGADVIVPNADLTSKQTINWTLTDRNMRGTVEVGVKYGSDVEEVSKILRKVADQHPKVSNQRSPTVQFESFGDSAINFTLWYWIDNFEDRFSIQTEMNSQVYSELRNAGIEIPFPQTDVNINYPEKDKQ